MNYIVTKRFNGKAMCGNVNLAYGTACEEKGNTIYCDGKPLCFVSSENAHQYFSRNDDGQGERRGELVHDILARLKGNQEAWGRIWEDLSIRKYKRVEFADYWLFNHDFYNAPVEDLEYILKVVKGETNGQNNQN